MYVYLYLYVYVCVSRLSVHVPVFATHFLCVLCADMEDYGFEYSDEEPEEQDVDIENQYYNSKGTVGSAGLVSCSLWSFPTDACNAGVHDCCMSLSK